MPAATYFLGLDLVLAQVYVTVCTTTSDTAQVVSWLE